MWESFTARREREKERRIYKNWNLLLILTSHAMPLTYGNIIACIWVNRRFDDDDDRKKWAKNHCVIDMVSNWLFLCRDGWGLRPYQSSNNQSAALFFLLTFLKRKMIEMVIFFVRLRLGFCFFGIYVMLLP